MGCLRPWAGADVNATCKWFWTPLHAAATEGHTEVRVCHSLDSLDIVRDFVRAGVLVCHCSERACVLVYLRITPDMYAAPK